MKNCYVKLSERPEEMLYIGEYPLLSKVWKLPSSKYKC